MKLTPHQKTKAIISLSTLLQNIKDVDAKNDIGYQIYRLADLDPRISKEIKNTEELNSILEKYRGIYADQERPKQDFHIDSTIIVSARSSDDLYRRLHTDEGLRNDLIRNCEITPNDVSSGKMYCQCGFAEAQTGTHCIECDKELHIKI